MPHTSQSRTLAATFRTYTDDPTGPLLEYGLPSTRPEPFLTVQAEGPISARVTSPSTIEIVRDGAAFEASLPRKVHNPFCYAIASNGSHVAVAGPHHVAVGRIDTARVDWKVSPAVSARERLLVSSRCISRVAMNEDGSLVAVGIRSRRMPIGGQPSYHDGEIRVFDVGSAKQLQSFPIDDIDAMQFRGRTLHYQGRNGRSYQAEVSAQSGAGNF